jgi:ferredoxin
VCSKPLPEDIAQQDFQHQGHIDIALLKAVLPHGAHQFYLCGPAGLLESVVPALLQWGVPKADIHFEAFGPSTVRLPADTQQPVAATGTAPLDICFAQSGRTLHWTGREGNLLEFAEQHGIAAQSGCRSGSCGSCVTTLTSGSVAYDTPPDYDLATNQCLLCVGIPRSNLVLEA